MTAQRYRTAVATAAAAACLAAPLLIAVDAPPALRFAAVLSLFCLAPGAALVGLLQPRNQSAELGLVIGVSLAADTLVVQAALALDVWQPRTFTYFLAATCILGITAPAVVRRGLGAAGVEASAPARGAPPR